ncbi:Cubilin [Babesia sp. Xinjiang]|uniref:Cubilin n=1 Tax=Babesia sp. Xinjiang TaxID=462227 RepID=UPI000A260A4F|nr:Cubilin [Babesia sp. Xinjiang]ORM39582.1 Cubilin [Babesia sp. Xinjiang]
MAAALILTRYAIAKDEPCDEDGNTCKNGATCIKVKQKAKTQNLCICKPQFTGWDCSVPLDFCKTHCKSYRKDISCQQALCNQGTCVNSQEYPYYTCNCGPFFSGQNCEMEYNPCSQQATNPCDHGTCLFIRGTNQVICQCHTGWTANLNQQIMKLTWNGTDIFVSPPCTEPVKRGITGAAPILTPKTKAVWYVIFILSLALLLWRLAAVIHAAIAKITNNTQ